MISRKGSLVPRTAAVWAGFGAVPITIALRRALQSGYDWTALRADIMAGLVVGIVALPLSMALAIAVGVPPQHGLYTAIVAGTVTALTGGSKFQVTGPTAAFVVILAPIVSQRGLSGLLTAGLMAGVILVIMGLARLGRLVQFIPHPVTTGFTTGIATVIATLQLKDALGLRVAHMPESFLEKVLALWHARHTASLADAIIAAATIALLLVFPKFTRRIPAPLVAITVVSVSVSVIHWFVPAFSVNTIGSRFSSTIGGRLIPGIPPLPPIPMLPWGNVHLSLTTIRDLMPSAFAIAILGAIESLLSAVIADGMTGKIHDSNAELVGQGLGNIVAPFFGGIAATGALARTATNIRSGARSPIASVVHALVVLLAILLLAPAVAYIPMASLAGLLLVVAYNMSEVRHFIHTTRVAPRSDVSVLLICYVLTVLFDMIVAISAGVMLAALLFMSRMAELTQARFLNPIDEESSYVIPPHVALYEIAGPLFFGAAQNAMGALGTVETGIKVLVLGLGNVPVIDATGLVALESALDRLRRLRKFVIIAGPLPQPREVFDKAQLETHMQHVLFASSVTQALQIARDVVTLDLDWGSTPPGPTTSK